MISQAMHTEGLISGQTEQPEIGSEDHQNGLFTLEKSKSIDIDTLEQLDNDQLKLDSLVDIYKYPSMDLAAIASGGNKASFMQWHCQGNLLMEMKNDSARMLREANALFDGSGSDSVDGGSGRMYIAENENGGSDDNKGELHELFFTHDSKMQPINNDAVKFLLKTFRGTEDNKLISAPFELTSKVEAFRAGIFDTINKEFSSVNLSEALVTVAFNHYAGHTKPGFMTTDEYMTMMQTYPGVFNKLENARFVFDAMDRRKRGVICLNDFIAGMVSCSPRASHKINSPSGRLRLQYIFKAYDVKRKGFLSAADLRTMLENIEQHKRMTNSDKEKAINTTYSHLGSPEYPLKEDSERRLNETMNLIMSNYENGLGYDAFYSCVSNGTIKETNLLFRSDKDFSESVGQHLIHGITHVVVRSEVNLPTEQIRPEAQNNLVSGTPKAHITSDMSPSKSSERSHKPSLWSTSNSPRSPERGLQASQQYSSMFARDDNPRMVQSARNRMLTSEPSISVSARDRFSNAIAGFEKKPLFQQTAPKGHIMSATNYLAPQEQLFRKNQQYSVGSDYTPKHQEYNRVGGVTRHLSINAPTASTFWRGTSTDVAVKQNNGESTLLTYVKQGSNNTNSEVGALHRNGLNYGAPFIGQNNSEDDHSVLVQSNQEPGYCTAPESTMGIIKTTNDGASGSYMGGLSRHPTYRDNIGSAGLWPLRTGSVAASRNGMIRLGSRKVDKDFLKIGESGNDMELSRWSSSKALGNEAGKGYKEDDNDESNMDLETILSRRITDLFRRYRARFVGFNSNMLSDHGVALKVFEKLYTRNFKNNDYQTAFARFSWCSYSELVELFDVTSSVVKQEPCVIKLQGTTQVHGPLNGNVATLFESFNSLGWPVHGYNSGENTSNPVQYAKGEATKLLFLGDMISDNEGCSLETMTALFSLKVLFPYHVFLLRGRRESQRRNYKSPLFSEIYNKLSRDARLLKLENDEALVLQSSHELYHRILDVFENMSIAACIEDRVLCIHGSLSNSFRSLEQLGHIPKPINVNKIDDSDKDAMNVRLAIVGRFSQATEEGHDGVATPQQLSQEDLKYSLRKSGMSMVISAGSYAERGYNYIYGERVLQLGGSTPGGTYSVALLKEHRNMHYFLTHRSIRVP